MMKVFFVVTISPKKKIVSLNIQIAIQINISYFMLLKEISDVGQKNSWKGIEFDQNGISNKL